MSQVAAVPAPSLGFVKMEERKRVATSEEAAPPAKRQATMANGPTSDEKAEPIKFGALMSPWQVELDTFQKDALIRQMRENKREKVNLEQQLATMEKNAKYHDSHIRVIDAWFSQMIQELRLFFKNDPSSDSKPLDTIPHVSSFLSADNEKFQEHLASRASDIKSFLKDLFSRLPEASPDTRQLQEEIARLLAEEKERIIELQQAMTEKELLADRLENASYRYLVAEKKLDRTKSLASTCIEMQGKMQSQSGESTTINGEAANGLPEGISVAHEELEASFKTNQAELKKVREQMEALEFDNRKLMTDLTTSNGKLATLSNDDYAKTELFKALKSQHEEVISRINHLEATNTQLREEAQKLQAERTLYRRLVDDESTAAIAEAEGQLAKVDADLQRIRAARDEFQAKNSILEATHSEHQLTLVQLRELNASKEERISALEQQAERLRIQSGQELGGANDFSDLESLSVEDLRGKIMSLQKQLSLLTDNELPSVESAWRKAQAVASRKVDEIAALEEKVHRLSQEKAKANEKYFQAMKAKEARDGELKFLRKQNAQSSDIVSQLKDAELKQRELCSTLEKELAETKETLAVVSKKEHAYQLKETEGKAMVDTLNVQVSELRKLLASKDAAMLEANHARREVEVESEKLKVKAIEAKKSMEEWKAKAKTNPSDEVGNLRHVAYCGVCESNLKNKLLKLCGHVICRECADKQIQLRQRKCPHCKRAFGANDTQTIHLI